MSSEASAPAPPPLPAAPPCARHEGSPAVGVCSRCGNFLCAACRVERASGVVCSECAEKVPDLGGQPIPWEQPGAGVDAALFGTAKLALLDRAEFFRRMPRTGGYVRPFVFYLLFAVPCGFAAQFLQWATGDIGGRPLSLETHLLIGLGTLFGSPLLMALIVGLYHGCALLVGARGRFEATWRIFCYVSGATVPFSVVPIVGPIVGTIWSWVTIYRGFRDVHELSPWRAIAAIIVLPIVFGCGIALLATGAIIAGVVVSR